MCTVEMKKMCVTLHVYMQETVVWSEILMRRSQNLLMLDLVVHAVHTELQCACFSIPVLRQMFNSCPLECTESSLRVCK